MTTSKSQAIKDLKWAIGINLLSLKICGNGGGNITAKNPRSRLAFSDLRLVLYFVSILIFSVFPQVMALIKVRSDVLLMVENLVVITLFIVVEFELITLWYKNEEITTMIEYMKNDWMRFKTEQERDVMLRYGKLSRIITIGGYLIIAVTTAFYYSPLMFGFVLRTVTNLTDIGDRPFTMQTFYLFDAYKTPVYELVELSQFVICIICSFCYTTVGTLFGVIVLHVSAQLENLYNRIQEMGNNDDTENFQVKFKLTVKEHERLIRFAKLIESTFSLMLLEVVTGFTFLVCVQGYQIVVVLDDDVQRSGIQIIVNIAYMLYIIFIMFVYSAVGEILVTRSERIQYATYNCMWYQLNPREAALFIPILVRSQRPLVITAGKFVSLTLPTFATLLKTTSGYLSFLLTMRD